MTIAWPPCTQNRTTRNLWILPSAHRTFTAFCSQGIDSMGLLAFLWARCRAASPSVYQTPHFLAQPSLSQSKAQLSTMLGQPQAMGLCIQPWTFQNFKNMSGKTLQQGIVSLVKLSSQSMKFSARQNRTLQEMWVSGYLFFYYYYFFHSTLAPICLHIHSMDAGLSHRAPSLSPNINYGSRLKALPTANPAAHSLCPTQHPDLLRIDLSSLQQRLRPSQPPITPPWRSHRQQGW